jgi:alpha-ketoglutarate-dependent taurine dioxygenase
MPWQWTGGETEFASSYVAYESLSAKKRKSADSVRVVHSLEAAQRLINDDPTPEELALWRTRPSKEHPLVWRAPVRPPIAGPGRHDLHMWSAWT